MVCCRYFKVFKGGLMFWIWTTKMSIGVHALANFSNLLVTLERSRGRFVGQKLRPEVGLLNI